jgi:hypothetical protein
MVVRIRYNLSDPEKGWKVYIDGNLEYYQEVVFNCNTMTGKEITDEGISFNIVANPSSYEINENKITFNS